MPVAVLTQRMVAIGLVVAGAHKLHWISCNPSAGLSVWELSDNALAAGAVVLDHYHTARESHNTNLTPPMQFENGIWLNTFTNMTSMTFGYV